MSERLPDPYQLLDRLEASLRAEIDRHGLSDLAMLGLHTGGAWIAERLHQRLGLKEALGFLDISFYRDDFSRIGMNPQVRPSRLPFQVEGRTILLIDDVFYTGRTIRAALNVIFDYGRPAQVLLGVLLERNGREIPIRPDCRGGEISLEPGRSIKLTGPEPLAFSVNMP